MSADPTRILAEISVLLRGISDSLLPGEEITLETRLVDDLGLSSIALANLSGRVQGKYGAAVNLVSFLAGRGAHPISSLRVGELVEYITSVLDRSAPETSADAPALAMGAACPVQTAMAGGDVAPPVSPGSPVAAGDGMTSQAGPGVPGRSVAVPDGAGVRNDNATLLAEHITGITRRLVRLDGGDVEVFSVGHGTPLILVHPLNVGVGVFTRQIASLADHYQVICMHNPGVGATTWQADVTLSGLARLYRTVLAELSVRPPFHVLGSCFGGVVAQEFALLHPAECASLVLAGCSYRVGGGGGYRPLSVIAADEFGLMAGSGDHAPEGDPAELAEHLLRCESMDPRAGLRYLALLATKPSVYAQLPEISAPTLLLRGEHDTMASAKDAHAMFGAIPDAQFAEVTNAGHFPYLTHPTEFGRHLMPFLAAHTGQGQQAKGAAVIQAAAHPGEPAAAGVPDLDRCVIISTGRCGSTLLSDLIAEDRETLSVYESLLPIMAPLTFMPVTEHTGAEYWALLSEVEPPGSPLLRAGVVPPEFAYPSSGRWSADNAAILPPILHVCLPKISADPDQLFDTLAVSVPRFPTQPLGLHHRMLLDLLAAMHGRHRWVERTGGSAMAAHSWLAACPDAKVIHLTRNLADTARSMSRHPVYQLLAIQAEFRRRYGAEPYTKELESAVPDAARLPEDMRRLLPGQLTARTFQELDLGPGVYETIYTQMNHAAEQALAELQPRQLLRLRYEDLAAEPADELTKVGAFLGFTDAAGWAARTAPRVHSPRAMSAPGGRGA
jgi:putative sulfotransferase